MKPLVVIPARAGSKGLPGKNIKKLNGKPLINYSIEVARKIFNDSVICVSTDSREIKEVAEATGLKVPFIRPKRLATDTANTQDVLLHALEYYRRNENYIADTVVLLQVTSPFRNADHVKGALLEYHSGLDMVVSVKETEANPYYVLREEDNRGYLVAAKNGTFTRRQDCPAVYQLNGAIYVISSVSLKEQNIADFKRVKKYLMSKEASMDIDDQVDWELAQTLIKLNRVN